MVHNLANDAVTTPLDAFAETLGRAPKIRQRAEAPLEAILWCDLGSEFAPILPALRAHLSNPLSLGHVSCRPASVAAAPPSVPLRGALKANILLFSNAAVFTPRAIVPQDWFPGRWTSWT
jgi:hypothetical protein